jgi:hypothetical protein
MGSAARTAVPAMLFLMSIASAFVLQRPIISRPTTTTATATSSNKNGNADGSSSSKAAPPRKFKNSVVELQLPIGATRIQALLTNDDILTRAVKETSDSLHVIVYSSSSTSTSTSAPASGTALPIMTEYVSALYSRLWDEMVQAKNIGLETTVTGNFDRLDCQFGAKVVSKKYVLELPETVRNLSPARLDLDIDIALMFHACRMVIMPRSRQMTIVLLKPSSAPRRSAQVKVSIQ